MDLCLLVLMKVLDYYLVNKSTYWWLGGLCNTYMNLARQICIYYLQWKNNKKKKHGKNKNEEEMKKEKKKKNELKKEFEANKTRRWKKEEKEK